MTRAAAATHLSQPAVTQAIAKLERDAGTALFRSTAAGVFTTDAGEAFATRVRRAFALLDPAFDDLSRRLRLTATSAQLRALIAVREAENYTLAAARLGVAQPTVHRAITQLESEAGKPLLERTAYGMVATRQAQALAQAARLAYAELEQAAADLAERTGREVGRIVLGAMPLSRAYILPRAIARFRARRPTLPIRVLEGPYDDLVAGLRRGEIDFLVGALRDPAPIDDVDQRPLFADTLVIVARHDHPLAGKPQASLAELARFPWVVSPAGTPGRMHFDAMFAPLGSGPASIVETGSMVLMRGLLRESDHLGFISRLQIEADLRPNDIVRLAFDPGDTSRPIGLTVRAGWVPTAAQAELLDDLEAVIAG